MNQYLMSNKKPLLFSSSNISTWSNLFRKLFLSFPGTGWLFMLDFRDLRDTWNRGRAIYRLEGSCCNHPGFWKVFQTHQVVRPPKCLKNADSVQKKWQKWYLKGCEASIQVSQAIPPMTHKFVVLHRNSHGHCILCFGSPAVYLKSEACKTLQKRHSSPFQSLPLQYQPRRIQLQGTYHDPGR